MRSFPLNTEHGIILCRTRIACGENSILTKLAVDTGASFSMIHIEAALAIGIDPAKSRQRIEITTANGIVLAPVITLPSLQCFGIEVKNIKIVCHNLPTESPVEGLLGLDFLKIAKVILDFDQNVIKVKD